MFLISLLFKAGCSALRSTIILRIARGSSCRLAPSAEKSPWGPSFSKRSTLRYIVLSGVPVTLTLSATELPNNINGRISSYSFCSGDSKSGTN